jgi:transposase
MVPDKIVKILRLAHENIALSNTERKLLFAMAHILQQKVDPKAIALSMPKKKRKTFLSTIAPHLNSRSKPYRTRALALTFHLLGIKQSTIAEFLLYSRRTVRKLIACFTNDDCCSLFGRQKCRAKKCERRDLKERLFALMHTPPADYQINRTTWTIDLLRDVLEEQGILIGKNTISKMIRSEGYNFRKTREVLTSNDPKYREKLRSITGILRRLGPADRFFSIDEYGPFSVKERGGRRRVRKGEYPTVPQYQDSKGFTIVTAALELTGNQVTHFYSKKKDTEEMIKLLELLIDKYWDCRRLYFSWDSASWHSSKKFLAEVKRVNSRKYRTLYQSPMIKLAPLPARAQFLNVIESVFSGMSQAIIHNSNYPSVDAAKSAIDKYFCKRNEHFRMYPKRAGNKIWGDELVLSKFSPSHNCKHPRFMRLASIR